MIDIVIVNWNSGVYLENCLASINSNAVRNIIILDNASSDNSCDFKITNKNIKLIKLNKNLGFGKACNIGAIHCESEFILFFNPDASLQLNTIAISLNYMRSELNSSVGILGVRLINESGDVSRSCSRFPEPILYMCQAIGIDRLFPMLGHSMAEWPHDTTQDVDQVIGAFFLVRRELFETLGGFDEQFFVYFEEVDFSYRAHKAGWRSVYLADVQAFHAGGGTSNQVKAKRLFYSLRSRLLYAFKHFHLFGAALVLMTTLFIEPISRSALAVARRSWSSLAETWQGYGMLWRWLPQWIFKGVTR